MHRDIFYKLYYHVTWSTHGRLPCLDDGARRTELILLLNGAARRHSGHVLACNAMPDHVHLLVALPPIDLAQFIGRAKGASSFAYNRAFGPGHTLVWQDGYGVVSLRESDVPLVKNYIESQESIHAARQTFPDMELYEFPAPNGTGP